MDVLANKFNQLKELIERADLSVKTNRAIVELLEEFSHTLYALKEQNARLLANYRSLDNETKRLRTQYSEILYTLSDIKSGER